MKNIKNKHTGKNLIAVTMGDPAGIGPEIVAKAIKNGFKISNCIPVVIGDKSIIDEIIHRLNLKMDVISINEDQMNELKPEKSALYLLDMGIINSIDDIKIGEISEIGGKASYRYIKKSVEISKKGYVKAVVTAPISKESIKLYGIPEAGHTEIYGRLTDSRYTATMFVVNGMRIFFHTRHIPLKKAIELLTVENIFNSINIAYKSMISIGYENPRLALAALNPHASDGGLFGDEEIRILKPACDRAKLEGINITGPVPADSVFHQCLEGKYDAVLSLYHDQGHIAAKTYNFYETVSVTLGLPFIRTSVDHGTAFDIAWKGLANPISMNKAINMACELSQRYKQIS